MHSEDEQQRARSARRYRRGPDLRRLEGTIALVARTLGFPAALVNIVDDERQQTLVSVGMPGRTLLHRAETICDVVVRTGDPLLVPDAAADPRFASLAAVQNGSVGSYVGVPLTGRESLVVGTLCVVDPSARTPAPDIVERLREFGSIVEDQLELLRSPRSATAGEAPARELIDALRDGRIRPWYQPILDLDTGRPVGLEALARWTEPSGSVRLPGSFLPLAVDTDLVADVDMAVLRSVLWDARRWQRTDPDVRVAVNLSPRHLAETPAVARITDAVTHAGLDPATVDLEVGDVAGPGGVPVDRLRALGDRGFAVWVDDPGTGWPTLSPVLPAAVRGVKIDRTVVAALGQAVGTAVVGAVVAVAAAARLHTSLVGVETADQAGEGRRLGCTRGQGHLWSPAVPAEAVPDLLAALRRR
ncbi:sensor domain-containing phosphodiesterase [Nakamurella endophytica]|uniref:EAL domain-containing protein n=1 Tax=Nakamurella endophytica TaxID=1748367 RepID=A0A917WDP2_9ACTN|nr:EAL domain-containing protein [Nakamurella endophytica]GGL93139.1 hypothetical protein GCM10011594_11190 [Nakamurella endophytica]